MAPGHGVVVGVGVVVQARDHHARRGKARIEIGVAVGDVAARDAGQPDDLAQAQQALELGLAGLLAQAGVAVGIEHAALGDDRRARAVDLDAAAFEHEPRAQALHLGGVGHVLGHFGVARMRLLVAPAVEVEIDAGPFARAVAHEHGAGVAHPQVVHRLHLERHAVAAQARGQVVLLLAHQQVHGLEGGDGAGDLRQVLARRLQQAPPPDAFAGAEGHPGGAVRVALVGHVPGVGRRGGGDGRRGPRQRGQAHAVQQAAAGQGKVHVGLRNQGRGRGITPVPVASCSGCRRRPRRWRRCPAARSGGWAGARPVPRGLRCRPRRRRTRAGTPPCR
ncbi:hypothetical protein D9M72_220580 [compost metagenome]